MTAKETCSIRMTAKEKGVDMKTALAIATIAFPFAAGPIATTIDVPLARPAASFAVAEAAGQNTASVWDGRWLGTTVSGHELVLDLRVKGDRLTGRHQSPLLILLTLAEASPGAGPER